MNFQRAEVMPVPAIADEFSDRAITTARRRTAVRVGAKSHDPAMIFG
jgi:hypothetical protein